MEVVRIKIKNTGDLPLPQYQTINSSGMDLMADIHEPITIKPGERTLIPTGLFIELKEGYEAQIRARSGLAIKYGITLLNGVGTIDADYRGEIKVILINLGQADYTIKRGDRIAQLVVSRFIKVEWQLSDAIEESRRGCGGFGHTGV
ncbi:MAG: dUTP diphosphatase [Clostridia bacterium]|nr:dUTP diphosphatase [Clostridia bacterium]